MRAAKYLVAGLALAGAAATGVVANSNPTVNDGLALNYALQLEHLEAAFYTKALETYDAAAFAEAGIPAGVRDYLELIKAHEVAHVDFLTSALTSAASPACVEYSFTNVGVGTIPTFLATAIAVEDIGVGAYTAALNHISTQSTQQAAATIATIEARHAAYLRDAVGSASANPATNVPFPEAVNTALLPVEVLSKAGIFFVNCTYNLTANVPTVRPGGVATDDTRANAKPSSATPTNPAPTYSAEQFQTDLDVLNYALTLEHFEAAFYNQFSFTAAQFAAATGSDGAEIVSNVALVKAHENAHVSALQAIISKRGGTAVTAGCYNWTSITDAATFLAVAATLENTGVSAYDGAAKELTDTGLQQTAAAVAVVEARHAAYLNVLTGKNATNAANNGAFDTPLTRAQVVELVSGLPYIVNKRLTGGCFDTSSSGTSGNPNSASFAAPTFAVAIVALIAAFVGL